MAIVKQIRLEKWVTSQDSNGENVETVAKYNLHAEVTKKGGARVSTLGQVLLQDSVQFRVRFRPYFKPSGNWRVVYDGNRHTVQKIEKEKENRFWWLITADSKSLR